MSEQRLPVMYADAQRLVATMVAAWPRFLVSAATVEVFCDFIAELDDLSRARAAVRQTIRSSHEWPTIAEIRVNYALAPSPGPEAELAAWVDDEREQPDARD